MTKKNDDELMKLTSAYRREASSLVSSLAGDTQFGDDDVVTSLKQCLGRNALAVSSRESPSLDIPSSFMYCHACGSWLQAGKNGTTLRLRSVGRGKTRRRRASRQKAAEIRAKTQSSVAGGRKWRSQDTPDDDKEERDLMRVTDGTCRNALVVTCGSCGYKLKYKGLPPVRQQTISKLKGNGHTESKEPVPKGLGEGDVISLPKKGTKHASKRSKGKGSTSRKQKKQAQSGSGLMNFLSSLND